MKIIIKESQLHKLMSEQVQKQVQNNSWQSSPKAQDTKKTQYVLNSLYKTSIPVDGNWMGKQYNETLKRYITDIGLKPYVCKKGDGWCSEQEAGAVTVSKAETQKFYDIRNADYNRVLKRK